MTHATSHHRYRQPVVSRSRHIYTGTGTHPRKRTVKRLEHQSILGLPTWMKLALKEELPDGTLIFGHPTKASPIRWAIRPSTSKYNPETKRVEVLKVRLVCYSKKGTFIE